MILKNKVHDKKQFATKDALSDTSYNSVDKICILFDKTNIRSCLMYIVVQLNGKRDVLIIACRHTGIASLLLDCKMTKN